MALGIQSSPSIPEIHKLADSILSEIFLFHVNEFQSNIKSYTQSHKEPSRWAPWNSAAVCQRWRLLCLDDPRIWTFVRTADHKLACNRVVRSDGYGKLARQCTHGLDLIRCHLKLERSRQLPLRVEADKFRECHSSKSMLQACMFHAHRWESFSFECDLFEAKEFQELLPEGTIISQLAILKCSADIGSQIPLLPLHKLSSLHTLLLSHIGSHLFGTINGFPWTQLHTLILKQAGPLPVSLTDLLMLLQQSSNIVILVLRSISVIEEEPQLAMNVPIFLKSLEELDVVGVPSMYILLPHLYTPQLSSIGWYIVTNTFAFNALSDLIARSQCKVTRLILTCFCCSVDDENHKELPFPDSPTLVPSLYQQLPYLETLVFHTGLPTHDRCDVTVIRWADPFLSPLTRLNVNGTVYTLPRLRRLAFLDVEPDPALLIGIVQKRFLQRPIANADYGIAEPIQRLHLKSTFMSKDVHRYLRDVITSALSNIPGLDLVIAKSKLQSPFESPAPRPMA